MGVLMKNGVNYTGFGAKNIAVAHYDSIGIPQVFFSDKAGNKVNGAPSGTSRYLTTITSDAIAFFKWYHASNGGYPYGFGAISLRQLESGVDYSTYDIHSGLALKETFVINGVTAYVYMEVDTLSESGTRVTINDNYVITDAYATDADITATSKFMKDIVATLTDGYTLPQEAVVRYSTEERAVGTWIDGKPLYQKTFTGSFSVTTTSRKWYSIYSVNDLASLHIDKCMFINGSYKEPNQSFYVDMGIMNGNDGIYCSMVYNPNEGINFVVCNGTTGTGEFIFTIQYTKTTD